MRGQQVAVTLTSDLTDAGPRALRARTRSSSRSSRSPIRSRARPIRAAVEARGAPRPRPVRRRASTRSTPRGRSTWPSAPSARRSSTTRGSPTPRARRSPPVGRERARDERRLRGALARHLRVDRRSSRWPTTHDGKKRSGYYWTARRYLERARQRRGGRAKRPRGARSRKLGSRKVETQEVAVVFDPDAARSIVGLLAGCVTGGAVWRKSSYLVEREGERDRERARHHRRRPAPAARPGSRPFDGEGLLVAAQRRRRARRAADVPARQLQRAQARASRAPRARRAARRRRGRIDHQLHPAARRAEARGAARRTPSARST